MSKASFQTKIDPIKTKADVGDGTIYNLATKSREVRIDREELRPFTYMNEVAKAAAKAENDFQYAVRNPGNLYDPNKYLPNFSIQTSQEGFVGEIIAPPFRVRQSEGRYLEWTPATTHRVYENEIATGEEPKEIEMEATYHTYSTKEYALANRIYKRDLQNSDPPARLLDKAGMALRNAQRLAREARVLNVALSPLVPAAAAAAGAWNLAAGTPITDVLNAMRQIYDATQETPTDIVIPFNVAMELINTTEWITRFGGYDLGYAGPLFKVQTGFENLGLRVHYSKVCGLTTAQGTPSDPDYFENIIGRQVLVFKRDAAPTLDTRCFMFTPYTAMDEFVRGEWGLEKKTRSVYMQIYEECQELLVDANCGYRITGV